MYEGGFSLIVPCKLLCNKRTRFFRVNVFFFFFSINYCGRLSLKCASGDRDCCSTVLKFIWSVSFRTPPFELPGWLRDVLDARKVLCGD